MLLLPIGNDREVFHFPYVTVGIIAICLFIQFYASFLDKNDPTSRIQEELQLRVQIWRKHVRSYLQERGVMFHRPQSQEEWSEFTRQIRKLQREFFRDYESGKIVSSSDPDYQRLHRLMQRRKQRSGVFAYGFRMQDIKERPVTLLTYMFIHGGWLHLIGNMLFLFVCGSNLEDRWGRGVWMGFYGIAGILAGLAFGLLHPQVSQVLVGASGAIAAAMGAFLLLFYQTRIRIFYFFWLILPFSGTFSIRAMWVLPVWLILQLLGLRAEVAGLSMSVAYSAHVVGFAFGMLTVFVFKLIRVDQSLVQASEKKAILLENHPLLEKGLLYKQQGSLRLAEASFASLLRQHPEHVDAMLELAHVKTEPKEVAALVNQAVRQAQRGGTEDHVFYVYRDIVDKNLTHVLDERSLYTIAKCFETKFEDEAFRLYFRITEEFPQSPIAPKAMLDLARLYQPTEPHRAIEVLQQLMTQYQGSTFAEQAHNLLRKIINTSTPSTNRHH